jgi:hypothetical protein
MANTSADVRAAWKTSVWDSATIQAFTKKIYLYDVSVDSAFNVAELYYGSQSAVPTINFFLCLVTRRQEPQIMNNTRYTFRVEVQYYLQQEEISSSTYNTLVDRLEAVDDLVRTGLTGTWSDTVDYYDGGTPQGIQVVTIDNKACWRGGFVYVGTKTV